jgi:hypothetical protein
MPPATAARLAAKILNRHSPHEIAEAIELLIDVLDILGGDPDAETGNDLEDDFTLTANAIERATSTPRVDCVDQDGVGYVEWHTLPSARRRSGAIDGQHCGDHLVEEDDEDDDADTSVEDNPRGFDPEEDFGIDDCPHDQEAPLWPKYGIDQSRGPINLNG